MQLFLICYIIIEICEIFTVGELPDLSPTVRIVSGGEPAAVLCCAGAGPRLLWAASALGTEVLTGCSSPGLLRHTHRFHHRDDVDPHVERRGGLPDHRRRHARLAGPDHRLGPRAADRHGYIALDTGFQWTHHFDSSYLFPNRHIALYVLYQLAPLVFLVAFYVLEAILVLHVLGERRPMWYLTGAAVLFAIGQIFNYVVSHYICTGTAGKIDGSMFETLFTALSVAVIWLFWSSITEDDWPMAGPGTYP